MQQYFITGTDTGVGKTTVACYLLDAMAKEGHRTLALKPVATGAEKTEKGLRQSDALKLQAHSTLNQGYDKVNPYVFEEPTSPHIAAKNKKISLSVDGIYKRCEPTLKRHADFLVVEGVGGWQVPLNDRETMADFAVKLGFPVLVVVGMRLGCFNHALLTVKQVEQAGLPIVGWFANCIEPQFASLEDYIETMKTWIQYPMLGRLDYKENIV